MSARYFVEDWLTGETIKEFKTEEERAQWLKENVNYFSDGAYLDDGRQICIWEWWAGI